MALPDNIQRLVTDGLSAMRAHPDHHFDWRTRRMLYRMFRETDARVGPTAHGWLAVIAAEHVAPMFTTTFPDDRLPLRLLRYATRVLTGSLAPTSWRLDILQDQGYMGTGIDMIDLRDGVVAYHAEYAGDAAYKALMEARGTHDLLDHVETLRRRNGTMVMGGGTTDAAFDSYEHGATFTDLDIAHLAAYSDTASAAAIAAACEAEREHIHPDRLRAYWEWWGGTAVPEAWRRASIAPTLREPAA
jgi:hypothetical protein